MTTRDVKADMKAALIQEHEGYLRANRTSDAEYVASVLKDQYGHDVAKKDGADAEKKKPESAAPERADAKKLPEAAVEPKPQRTVRSKPAQSDGK